MLDKRISIREHWNKSHFAHPLERSASNYAKDKEKNFPRNSVVCDLGGGDGTDSLYFLQKGHSVYLYDISDLAIKRAKEKADFAGFGGKLNTGLLDLETENIPVNDEFFDIVYSRLSLHYFYPERTTEILKDIYRVLKKTGTAHIVVKSPEDKAEMKWLEEHDKKLEEGVYSGKGIIKTRYSKEKYENMLEKAGIKSFQVNSYTEYFGKEKVYVKSQAEELLYIEIIIKK